MQAKLTISTGDLRGTIVNVDINNVLTLGRSSACNIVLKKDPLLSRVHCQFELTEHGAYITDLCSANGTFVNEERIVSQPLKSGDKIRIGRTNLVFTNFGQETIQLESPSSTTGIGGYQVLEKLGEGGMGAVYKALQVSMDRLVALKVLNTREGDTETAGKKFLREARSGAKVAHNNIVRFFDCGQDRGVYYVVMEYIEGKPLDAVLEGAPHHRLPPAEAVGIAIQIADALGYLFSLDLVHRDVKPANIVIDEKGVPKLTDFGLTKKFQGSALSGLTKSGEGKGSVIYMPPEQLDDALHADQRADIYSLGATLYHMVTGRMPFYGTTLQNLMHQVEKEYPPKAHKVNPKVSRDISKIIEKCMMKDKERRYQTPAELHRALKTARRRRR